MRVCRLYVGVDIRGRWVSCMNRVVAVVIIGGNDVSLDDAAGLGCYGRCEHWTVSDTCVELTVFA